MDSMAATIQEDEARAKRVAYDLLPAAWVGLSDDDRAEVLAQLNESEYEIALDYLLSSEAALPQQLVAEVKLILGD